MQHWRLVGGFLVVGLICSLMAWIPLPGISPSMLGSPDSWSRMSIGAIGIAAYLQILAVREVIYLCLGISAGQERGRWAFWSPFLVKLSALLLTAVQGYGVMTSIAAASDAPEMADAGMASAIACLVGATGILIHLAERLTLPGLRFGGLWAILTIGALSGIVTGVLSGFELLRMGGVDVPTMLITHALPIVTCAGTVLMAGLLQSAGGLRGSAQGGPPRDLLIWPLVVASQAAVYITPEMPDWAVALASNYLDSSELQWFAVSLYGDMLLTVAAVLTIVFVLAYLLRQRLAGPLDPRLLALGLIIAAIEVVLNLAPDLLSSRGYDMLPGGQDMVILTLVMLGIWERLRDAGERGGEPTERPASAAAQQAAV